MHRLQMGTMAAALVLAAALPVLAAGEAIGDAAEATGHAVKEGAETTGHYVKEGAEAAGKAVAGAAHGAGEMLGITGGEKVTPAEAARYETAEKAEHEMRGTITKIDRDDGMVQLATDEALLKLPFQPASIQRLQDGQKITVQLAYVKLPVAVSAKKIEPSQTEANHRMKGRVQNLDRKSGIFDLDTADVTAQVHFPPSKIDTLKNGDQVAVEVAMLPEPTKGR